MKNKTCGECHYFNPEIITRNGYGMCTTGRLAGQHVDSMMKACDWSIGGSKRQITNGDRIRQMSNEELIAYLDCTACIYAGYDCSERDCVDGKLAWLNAPAESGKESEGKDVQHS